VSRRRHPDPPFEIEDKPAGMTAEACAIAVSEISGIPVGEMCNWVLVVSQHRPDKGPNMYRVGIIPWKQNWAKVRKLLEIAAADAEVYGRR
jgi:hypothetical protein